jgi:hypothetical protein
MGRTRPFGFHKSSRKEQPKTEAERFQKIPKVEMLKR